MPEIAIEMTEAELRRIRAAAVVLGQTVEQMVADELRARYALLDLPGKVIPLRLRLRKGGVGDGHD
jgi:hypothetical protein